MRTSKRVLKNLPQIFSRYSTYLAVPLLPAWETSPSQVISFTGTSQQSSPVCYDRIVTLNQELSLGVAMLYVYWTIKHIFFETCFSSIMKIRRIRCVPIEIDTERHIILVKEGDKNAEYSVHGTKISEDFESFLAQDVFATLYDDRIAKMQPVPKAG